MPQESPSVPWSARAPQRYAFAVLAPVLGIAVMLSAIGYLRDGTGGVVPVLMLLVAPVLAAVYVYYFAFKKFDDTD